MAPTTYKKRSGTLDRGKDYEYLLCAYYALKFAINDDVIDFEMSTNNEIFGDLDDLILEVKYADGSTRTFLFQIKHTEKRKSLTTASLISPSGDSSLFKYLKSFATLQKNQIALDDFVFIFFTNREACFDDNLKLSLESQEIFIKHQECVARGLLDTSKTKECSIFKFETGKYHDDFFNRFFLYVNQQNDFNLRETVAYVLKDTLTNDVPQFIDYMRNWWAGNFKLSKRDVITKLTEIVFSPMIQTLTDEKCNEKTELLKEAILVSDLTLIEENCNDVTKIWQEVTLQIKEASLIGLKYGLLTKGINRLDELSLETKSKMLWYLNEAPLIIKYDTSKKNQISNTIRLLEKSKPMNKIVLVGVDQEVDTFDSNVFKNLEDLPEELRKKILVAFSCKLQGKPIITLEELTGGDSSLGRFFDVVHLLRIALEDNFNIGEDLEKLPSTYIPRTIPKILLNITVLDGIKSKIFLHCRGSYQDIQKKCKKHLIKITKYNTIDIFSDPERNIFVSEDNFKHCRNVYTREETLHHFKIIDDTTLQWIYSNQDVAELEKYRRSANSTEFFEKFHLDNHLHNRIWILTSHTGGGKTTLLTSIKNQLPPNCFVIKINLKEHSSYFLKQHEVADIWEYFLELTAKSHSYTNFEAQLLRHFDNEKIIFLWDGFDELHDKSRQHFINSVKGLHEMGVTQWITSRNTFQKILESIFSVFAIVMQPLHKEEQSYYIQKRSKIDDPKILNEFFKNINILDDSEYLGVPLQLYILTDIFNQNPETLKTILTLTDMCQSFISGKYTHFLKKTKTDVIFLKGFIEDSRGHRMEQYKIVALKTHLPEFFATLSLRNSPVFIDDVKKGDFLGLIVKINDDGSAIFEHNIFSEYLCALWLSENASSAYKCLYLEKSGNIKFMFDLLLAENRPIFLNILYKKYGDVSKCEIVKDRAGRSPLHVISTYGQRHPVLSMVKESKQYVIIDPNPVGLVQVDNNNLKLAVEYLMTQCDSSEKDNLFGWTCYNYADESECLGLIETLGGELDTILPTLKYYKNPATVLYYSIKLNYLNLFEVITQIPFVEDEEGGNLLHLAAEYSREKILQSLLNEPSYLKAINRSNDERWTPIHYASFNGNLNILKCLKEKGGTFPLREPSVLALASANGYQQIVEFLLECNVSPNDCYHSNYFTQSLPLAISRGYLEIVEFLVNKGAKLYKIGKNRMSALQLALDEEQFEIAEFFLRRGMNIDDVDEAKESSFHHAAINDNKSVVLFLLERKANVRVLDGDRNSPLHFAAKSGSLEVAEIFLKEGLDINQQNRNGSTPLHLAVLYGDGSMIKFLIQKGADIKSLDKYGRTPLHYAALHGLIDSISLLLEQGADIDIRDKLYGRNPLHYAAWKGHEDCVEFLIQNGANVNSTCNFLYTPLHLAAEDGHYESCQLLLKHGASVSIPNRYGVTPVNKVRRYNYAIYMLLLKYHPAPLHEAAFNVEADAFVELLQLGYEINGSNETGVTPLHVAVGRPKPSEFIKMIIEKGANIKAQNLDGYLPLHCALQSEFPEYEAVEALIEADPTKKTINALTKKQLTPLHIASQAGGLVLYLFGSSEDVYLKLVKLLIEEGAEIDAEDDGGFTPLHYASRSGNVDIIDFLHKNGSLINKQNLHGRTPLHMAATQGSLSAVNFLLEQGALPDVEDKDGDTPVDDAFTSEHPRVLQLLLTKSSKPFEINQANHRGKTALHMAAKEGSPELVDFFLKREASADVVDNDGNTPLEDALFNRRFKALIPLMKVTKNFDVNKFNKRQKRYPLHVAAACGELSLVKYLLEKDARIDVIDEDGNTPLHDAVQYKQKKVIKLLVTHDEDGDVINKTNKHGDTALHFAADACNQKVVKYLVQSGARIDIVNSEGDRPFDLCFNTGNIICVNELLVNLGNFDFDKQSGYKQMTLLHFAVEEDETHFALWLIEKGASINIQESEGYTPLHLAFKKKFPEMVRLLIENFNDSIDFAIAESKGQKNILHCAVYYAPDLVESLLKQMSLFESLLGKLHPDILNMTECDVKTLLHLAAEKGCVNLVRVLVRNGALINEVDRFGHTPSDIAAKYGHLQILELLLEKDTNATAVNKSDSNGSTLLHLAVEDNNLDLVKLLLRKGARVDLVDENGETAYDLAVKKNHSDIKRFFDTGMSVEDEVEEQPVRDPIGDFSRFLETFLRNIF